MILTNPLHICDTKLNITKKKSFIYKQFYKDEFGNKMFLKKSVLYIKDISANSVNLKHQKDDKQV